VGWQDRDYATPTTTGFGGMYGGFINRSRSVVTILIIANVFVFVLCIVGAPRSGQFQGHILGSKLFQFGLMETTLVVKHGQVWRIVTSDYLHWGMWHLLLNMLGLYFLGRPLEQLWGGKKFFWVYTAAGILSSLFYMSLNLIGFLPGGPAAGASGCVLALLGAGAVLFPHAELLVYGIFPVKMRTLAIVLACVYVLNIYQKGDNAGGDACHLAGLAFGVWWSLKGDAWWFRWRRSSRTAKSLRVDPSGPTAAGFRKRMAQRREDAALVDQLLAKVHDGGIGSLTEREKRALAEATERQQLEERPIR
jgi:membrane associated rhomboid family serine protease